MSESYIKINISFNFFSHFLKTRPLNPSIEIEIEIHVFFLSDLGQEGLIL